LLGLVANDMRKSGFDQLAWIAGFVSGPIAEGWIGTRESSRLRSSSGARSFPSPCWTAAFRPPDRGRRTRWSLLFPTA
jgi:hypothetical protein